MSAGARWIRVAVIALTAAAAVSAQTPRTGRLVPDTLHSKLLSNNKYGDSPDRETIIYLPPSYDSARTKRYPVVYLLNAFGATDRTWVRGYGTFNIQAAMDSLVAAGAVQEMIVVMPNALTKFGGSFYTNSAATGAWDDLISRELVAYVDGKYRTLARPESRGLAGHSMGGYGTFAVGMRHAGDVYGALYALSGCCTQFARQTSAAGGAMWQRIATTVSLDSAQRLAFYPKVSLALAAAFSPDTAKPPLFVDLPFAPKDSQWVPVPAVQAKWIEHAPYDMVPTYADRLRRLRGFAFDVGTRDQLVSPRELAALDSAFSRNNVPHTYETYDGDHTNTIGLRMITKVLPFFSRTLDASSPR